MSKKNPSPSDPTPPRGTPIQEPPPLPMMIVPPSHTPPPQKLTNNPQIIAAIITGVISLVIAFVGLVPSLIKDDDPVPTAIIFTHNPPSLTPSDVPQAAAPTATPDAYSPTIVSVNPATTSLPVAGSTLSGAPTAVSNGDNEANVRIYFEPASFTIRNLNANKKILQGISFVGGDGLWSASSWGSFYDELNKDLCLRLRDAALTARNPPADCQGSHLLGLMLVGPEAIFWRDPSGFTIERNGIVLASCSVSPCEVYLPKD